MIIDANEHIELLIEFNGVEPLRKPMHIFFDESGNCRTFKLNERGVNSDDALIGDFVLAGVAYENEDPQIGIDELKDILNIRQPIAEIKYKNLYKSSSSFLDFMNSESTNNFLEWLLSSKLFIHYTSMNNFFFSIVDIVDTLWEIYPQCFIYKDEIKNDFFDFCLYCLNDILKILYTYNYPDIKDQKGFSADLCSLIKSYNDSSAPEGFCLEMLRQMIKDAGRHNQLLLLQDNQPFVLIDNYLHLYINRCCDFINSTIVFDKEPYIEKRFKQYQITFDGEEASNYSFQDSHENVYIQLSDIVAGLLRKLFMFLDYECYDIEGIKSTLNDRQRHNFKLIWDLISKSDAKSPLLVHNINTVRNVLTRMCYLECLKS